MKKGALLAVISFLFSFFCSAQMLSTPFFERTLHFTKDEEPTATDSILRFWLSPQVVNSNRPVANTFYFWTSSKELDSSLAQNQLLRTNEQNLPVGEYYWEELMADRRKNDLMLNHLRGAERQRVRFAWPNYWADLTEAEEYSVNDQLVQVVLMDSALIVAFDPEHRRNRWTVYDLQGNVVPMEIAMKRKEYIAAVFMCGYTTVKLILPRPVKRYRENYRMFALCNEKMIKSWHHAVPGMQDMILQDLNYLLLLNAYFRETREDGTTKNEEAQGKRGINCTATWVKSAAEMRINELYFATQAWAGRFHYAAGSNATQKIINELRYRWPIQKYACERFPGRYPVYIPPRK